MIECKRMQRSDMKKKDIYFFIGTTAELIKLAPVIKQLKINNINFKIISSSQNRLEFSELKFLFGKQTTYYKLKLKPFKLPNFYFRFAIWMIKAVVNFFLYFRSEFKGIDKKNSFFIVHGDTISSLIGALVAKIHGIRLVHIESGLRSFNFFEPFPEEICRFIVSKLADIHFCPNSWAVNNLRKTGGVKINTQNNTLIETVYITLKNTKKTEFKPIQKRKYFILVLHRQEHILFKKNLTKNILNIFAEYTNKDLACILVLHKLTEKFLRKEKLIDKLRKNKNIILIPRLPYTEFIHLMEDAEFIATDGGSNQEESFYLGKPCLILRNVTERIEGLGENTLLSHGAKNIIRDFVKNYKKYERRPASFAIPPSKIIVDYLIKH